MAGEISLGDRGGSVCSIGLRVIGVIVAYLRVQEQQRHQEAMAEFAELREITKQQTEIARQQAESISRLIGLLERQDG